MPERCPHCAHNALYRLESDVGAVTCYQCNRCPGVYVVGLQIRRCWHCGRWGDVRKQLKRRSTKRGGCAMIWHYYCSQRCVRNERTDDRRECRRARLIGIWRKRLRAAFANFLKGD